MSMDLIISGGGDILIASNQAFPAEVARVDFIAAQRLLMLHFHDHDPEGQLLNLEVHDRMMSALLKAPSVLLIQPAEKNGLSGFEVPLVQITSPA